MNFITQMDPTGEYKDRINNCIAACGILPQFASGPHDTVEKNMEKNYQFFMGWSDPNPATVDEDGTFNYPGDPPMAPLAKIVGNREKGEVVYIYPHAFVGVTHNGKLVKYTRMD